MKLENINTARSLIVTIDNKNDELNKIKEIVNNPSGFRMITFFGPGGKVEFFPNSKEFDCVKRFTQELASLIENEISDLNKQFEALD